MSRQFEASMECVRYILFSEEEDFEINPSENHIYFHAMVAEHGLAYALDILKQALEENEK